MRSFIGAVIILALGLGVGGCGCDSTCGDPKQDCFAACGGAEWTESATPVVGGDGCYECICKPKLRDMSIPDMTVIDHD